MRTESQDELWIEKLEQFLSRRRRPNGNGFPAISLFSGAGISDLGYEYAGFRFVIHAEIDNRRANLCASNFPRTKVVVGDIRKSWRQIIKSYRQATPDRLALLSVTPPCQGMSSSNPSRGKVTEPDGKGRNERNLLLLAALPIIQELRPMCVVVENVPQALVRRVQLPSQKRPRKIVETFFEQVGPYSAFAGVVQMADYGIPQVRRRAVLVLLDQELAIGRRLEERGLLPWPRPTHSETGASNLRRWITLKQWLTKRGNSPLDSRSAETARDCTDPLHYVPHYEKQRYLWVRDIPPNSGRSAYENDTCPHCGEKGIKLGEVRCPACGDIMVNRPYVKTGDNGIRLIRGFKSSYRRMRPDRPAPTVTTASSHLGSDYKIHPWENRVLSIRECIELQTIPRAYSWDLALTNGYHYLIRQVVGEAIPPWFTYLHGRILRRLLQGKVSGRLLAKA
ncbi:MAG: DNA cytosine methyltransferase [Deltaproteobacteria bacterium]|nr:DNA cytosine methyltransferase [Deltaproteobacteria bacterium]